MKPATQSVTLGGLLLVILGALLPLVISDAKTVAGILEGVGIIVAAFGRIRKSDLHWPWEKPGPPAPGA